MVSFRYLQLFVASILLSLVLSSCMVGPNFHAPQAPSTDSYTSHALPTKTVRTPAIGSGGHAQHFVRGADIPGEWWKLFHSKELNQLIVMGLANSPNLAAAKATLRQSQEALNAQIGSSLLPAVNGQIGGGRQQINSATSGITTPRVIFNLYNASVNVSYTPDVFGAARRQIESLQAQVDNSQYELLAAYLTMTSNIVTTAINIASLEDQIKATKQLIEAEAYQLKILEKQLHLGGVSLASILTQKTLLDQTRASLPPLQKSLAQSEHALAVLIGVLPSASHLPKFSLRSLHLPTEIPMSIPSKLIHQRPDILAAEALLHSASAQVGVATANLYPQLNLTGAYGWQSLLAPTLFERSTNVWSYGAQILQPIFAGGSLLAKQRGAIDAYQNALAQYRQTVLQGFQNVADTLRALETDARTLQAQRAAEVAAKDSLVLTEEQFHLGGTSYLALLVAQEQYQQTYITRIQAEAERYADTAALFQAMGGGWWNTHC